MFFNERKNAKNACKYRTYRETRSNWSNASSGNCSPDNYAYETSNNGKSRLEINCNRNPYDHPTQERPNENAVKFLD